MAQTRFIGVNQDLTQEIFLLLSSTSLKAGVVNGLEASVEIANTGFQLRLKPGLYILPDGMIIQETTDQVFPLTTGLTQRATLLAYRDLESGSQSDIARYTLVQDFVTQDTIDKLSNRVYLPLTWIEFVGNTGTVEDFRILNIGSRNKAIQKSYRVPFSNLIKISNIASPIAKVVSTTNLYNQQTQQVPVLTLQAGEYYIYVEPVENCIPAEILVVAKGGSVEYLSLNGVSISNGVLAGTWNFSSTDWAKNLVSYPLTKTVNWGLTEDLLKIKVLATLDLMEILITWVSKQ